MTAPAPLLLVGAGRWGRVLLQALPPLLPPDQSILWVSRRGTEHLEQFLSEHSIRHPVVCHGSLEAALALRPSAALLATETQSRAAQAAVLLEAGCHLLVEKPLALDLETARDLVALAGDRVLAVHLEFLTAPFLDAFAAQLGKPEQITRISLDWQDPVQETRYGEVKRADSLTPLCHDLLPHVWSIWRCLLPDSDPSFDGITRHSDGSVSVAARASGIKLRARIGRNASQRRRMSEVAQRGAPTVSLDFAEEPGRLLRDGEDIGPLAADIARPLATSLGLFLEAAAGGSRSFPLAAESCQGSVALAEAADQALRAHDAQTPHAQTLREHCLPVIAARDLVLARRCQNWEGLDALLTAHQERAKAAAGGDPARFYSLLAETAMAALDRPPPAP